MNHRDEAAIRARAYQLWEESGCADGSQDAHWRQAERAFASNSTGEGEKLSRQSESRPSHVDAISHLPAIEGTDGPPRRIKTR